MFFSRTHEFALPGSKDEFRNRLLGKRMKIHNLDFEVVENDYALNIIPHAENEHAIKTLPITELEFRDDSGKTRVVMKFKLRKLDAGGPQLILIFCTFLLIASVTLFFTSKDIKLSMVILAICLLIFTTLMVRLQTGYFDYVRKIHNYVKKGGA